MSLLPAIALLVLSLASIADAGLSLTLTKPDLVAVPGAEVLLSGLITNTSATDKIYLNDITAGATSGLTLKPNTFFANVPGILLPGESYHGLLFKVKLESGAAPADYSGTFTIQGGPSIMATLPLASADYTLLAKPVSQWRYLTFGAEANDAAASDSADWDEDGGDNLLEYALGTNAKSTSSRALITAGIINNRLSLSYAPALTATDVGYTVQASTDLIHWSTSGVERVAPDLPGTVTYRYTNAVGLVNAAFLRLCVSR
jgi:hypothetical protein